MIGIGVGSIVALDPLRIGFCGWRWFLPAPTYAAVPPFQRRDCRWIVRIDRHRIFEV